MQNRYTSDQDTTYLSQIQCTWIVVITLTKASIWCKIMGRLANSTNGLGRVNVKGRRRVPKPSLNEHEYYTWSMQWTFTVLVDWTTTAYLRYEQTTPLELSGKQHAMHLTCVRLCTSLLFLHLNSSMGFTNRDTHLLQEWVLSYSSVVGRPTRLNFILIVKPFLRTTQTPLHSRSHV